MIHEIQAVLTPKEAYDPESTQKAVARITNVDVKSINAIHWINRSIDSRKFPAKIIAKLKVFIDEKPKQEAPKLQLQNVENAPSVHIIGAGPAGYFAALELIEQGFKPIIFEQGKDVNSRKRDIADLAKNQGLNEDSNYAFGEGGAGTFSDGKLFTRVKKRDEIRKVLDLFYEHGASADILFESHPHIGTDVLPRVIENMRKSIEKAGGKVFFEHKVTDLEVANNAVKAIIVNGDLSIDIEKLILACGHSAYNLYEILNNKNILIESKGFAMGIRLEHPQELINSIQYHTHRYDKWLPPATYSIAKQVDGRGIYSFCMCPGGIIVPATTMANRTVVNGMSNSKRNSLFANSGIVVELRPEELEQIENKGVMSGLSFQKNLEQMAYTNGGSGQVAPAQRMYDFVKGRISSSIPSCSYIPGVISSPLNLWLPEIIGTSLRKAFEVYGKQIKGFLTNEAVIVGVESRTSSPIRIPRDKEALNHVQIANLYPAGEGAGYAGGIVSSAIDGILIARSIARNNN